MLKDLTYTEVFPSFIYAIIAQTNGVDLSQERNYFKHCDTGVYIHDGYMFNFNGFINDRCQENIVNEFPYIVGVCTYGVCDNYQQILDKYKEILDNSDKKYVIGMSTVERKEQSSEGGWRWHKWGKYIGKQNPQHEYLYDDTHIDKVYCFHIYEVE